MTKTTVQILKETLLKWRLWLAETNKETGKNESLINFLDRLEKPGKGK